VREWTEVSKEEILPGFTVYDEDEDISLLFIFDKK